MRRLFVPLTLAMLGEEKSTTTRCLAPGTGGAHAPAPVAMRLSSSAASHSGASLALMKPGPAMEVSWMRGDEGSACQGEHRRYQCEETNDDLRHPHDARRGRNMVRC